MFFSRRKKYQHPGDESRKYQSRTLSHVVRKIKGSEEKARAAKEEADDQGVDPLAEEEEEAAAAAAAAAEEEEDWRSAVLEYDDADRHEGPRFTRGGAAHADTNRLNDAAPLGAKEEANALATFTSGRVKEAAEMGLPMASAFLQISFKSIFFVSFSPLVALRCCYQVVSTAFPPSTHTSVIHTHHLSVCMHIHIIVGVLSERYYFGEEGCEVDPETSTTWAVKVTYECTCFIQQQYGKASLHIVLHSGHICWFSID